MGYTQKLGLLAQSVFQDSSLNVGIGAAPSGTYKFEVTGTAKVSSTLLLGGALSGTSALFTSLEVFDNSNSGILKLSRDAGGQRGQLQFGRNNGGSFQVTGMIGSDSDSASPNNGTLYFYTSNSSGVSTERMKIYPEGEIGIKGAAATEAAWGLLTNDANTGYFNIFAGGSGTATKGIILKTTTGSSTVNALTLASTGAATFSGSVNLGGYLTGQGTNPGGLGGSRYVIDWLSGSMRIFSYGADASTNGGFVFNSQRSDGTNSFNPMTITSGGNVGIGQSTPIYLLDLKASATPLRIVQTTSASNQIAWIKLRQSDANNFGADIGIDTTTGGDFVIGRNNATDTFTETFRIARANGNIGIGCVPSFKLQVQGDDAGPYDQASGQIVISGATNSNKRLNIGYNTTNNIGFIQAGINGTGYSTLLLNPNGGNVGIGTTSPSIKFTVLHAVEEWASKFSNSNGTESVDVFLAYGAGNGIAIDSTENDSTYVFKAMAGTGGGGGKGSVPILYAQCNGNVGLGTSSPSYRLQLSTDSAGKPNGGSWANSSDIRLKENIKTIDNALDKIMQLRGVTFDWKDETEQDNIKESAGFIADEVMLAFPNWVRDVNASSNQKELINDDKVKSLSLPFEFDAMLVEAIKELSAQNQDLKSRLDKAGL